MARPERCVVCNEIIPEGRQVCLTCEKRAFKTESPPTGYITARDISNMSQLKGYQILALLDDYGVRIGPLRCMKFFTFDELRRTGALSKYAAGPTLSGKIRLQNIRWGKKRGDNVTL